MRSCSCYMPSGKLLWLCAEHRQQDDRITVLTDDGDDAVVDAYQRDNIAVESLHGRLSTNKPASPVKTAATSQQTQPGRANPAQKLQKEPCKPCTLHNLYGLKVLGYAVKFFLLCQMCL